MRTHISPKPKSPQNVSWVFYIILKSEWNANISCVCGVCRLESTQPFGFIPLYVEVESLFRSFHWLPLFFFGFFSSSVDAGCSCSLFFCSPPSPPSSVVASSAPSIHPHHPLSPPPTRLTVSSITPSRIFVCNVIRFTARFYLLLLNANVPPVWVK